DVDRDLLSLLARRAALVRRAGDVKAELGSPVYDARREADLLTLRDAWARELGLPESPVRDVFLAVLRLSRGLQQRDPAT
ncbi:MAG: prephenate dehydrogenase/arogenate dehydrogenase family protein, partial [Acidobacteria bacterium]|nr:prephenate dehydrogenase/arogenate dehydrogenase family protein [Acidobacteriota bacterium]